MANKDDVVSELGRLAALAARFSSEGQMNLNKLVEAASYAYIRRAGWSYRPNITSAMMESELAEGMDFLRQQEAISDLLPVLEAGKRALAEHREDDLPIGEAPDAFVCRVCGHMALAAAPERCPDCGAVTAMFRRFVAISGWDNTDPVNPTHILDMLTRGADDLSQMLDGISEERAAQVPNGIDWSIRDHVAHLAYLQDVLDMRVDLMLKYQNPELAAAPPSEQDADGTDRPSSFSEVLNAFLKKRRSSLELLQSLPLKDLWRTGRHPEYGQITILRQAAYVAYHEQTHLQDIEALLNLQA